MIALKYKGLHRAQSMLSSAIQHWKWPAELELDTHESHQLPVEPGIDEDGYDSDASLEE